MLKEKVEVATLVPRNYEKVVALQNRLAKLANLKTRYSLWEVSEEEVLDFLFDESKEVWKSKHWIVQGDVCLRFEIRKVNSGEEEGEVCEHLTFALVQVRTRQFLKVVLSLQEGEA